MITGRLVEVVQDVDGQISSKRVVAFLALGGYFLAGAANALGHALDPAYVSGLRDLTIGGIALSVPERFGNLRAKAGDPPPLDPANPPPKPDREDHSI